MVLHYDCAAAKHFESKLATKVEKLLWITEG